MKSSIIVCIAMLLLVASAYAHICIYNPHQRGDLDISGPSGTCFRPKAPCGDQSVENPVVTWEAGSKQEIHFQQNLNHYSVGYPGYFDISYSTKVTDSQDDFDHIDYVRDVYYHRELHQHNFTYQLTVPEESTEHGIVQMRYISHKPGEPIFHQCFDVKIVPKKQKMKVVSEKKSKAATPTLYSLRYNPNEDMVTELIKFDESSNSFTTVTHFPAIVATSVAINNGLYSATAKHNHERMKNAVNLAFIEDVFYYNDQEQTLNFLVSDQPSNPDVIPTTIYTYSLKTGEHSTKSLKSYLSRMKQDVQQKNQLASDNDLSISMVRVNPVDGNLLIVSIVENTDGSHQWVLYSINDQSLEQLAVGPETEKYYINFLWGSIYDSKHDQDQSRVTFIMRNEHDPFNMTQQMYTVMLHSKETLTTFNSIEHSFSCHHPLPYAFNLGFSVGSFNNYLPKPKVISNELFITPSTSPQGVVAGAVPEIKSYPYQGGCVQQGLNADKYQVYHVYQRLSPKDRVLVRLNFAKDNVKVDMSNHDRTLPYMYNLIVVS